MSKFISILSYIDDTYDACGTIDELELFTKAIESLAHHTILMLRIIEFVTKL